MIYLFSKGSIQVLESLSFTNTLYAFDFDGTLAPIVKNPDDARMKPSTEKLLTKLSMHLPTAVISGRSLTDLKRRIPKSIKYQIGNHGLEGLPEIEPMENLKQNCTRWKRQINIALNPYMHDLGIEIEDKTYSLSVHYRKSRKRKFARLKIQEVIAQLGDEPKIILGKLVFNILPRNGPHKGNALLRLQELATTKFSFFIGDDDTDEDVFTLPDRKVFSVRIGNRNNSSAKYYLRTQSEINHLLQKLLDFHGIK